MHLNQLCILFPNIILFLTYLVFNETNFICLINDNLQNKYDV